MIHSSTVPVIDAFGAANDPAMPFLGRALDPIEVQRQFESCLTWGRSLCVRAIRVVRHKPGRRCLIEYDIETPAHAGVTARQTLIGKIRAKGVDHLTYQTQISLRNVGFSSDGILVPEPVGLIPELHMWLQQKVSGVSATRLLTEPDGVSLAAWVAEAAHKLHSISLPPVRRHSLADELRILHERLPMVAVLKQEWSNRIERLLAASDRLGASIPVSGPVGIHRDFYPDQILVDGECLYLLDFDLFCEGDRGLDIGNFVAHITEHALRTTGEPTALRDREHALIERFIELSGESVRPSIQVYTILTLIRHIYLSTQFLERRHTTAALLELCEERLGIARF